MSKKGNIMAKSLIARNLVINLLFGRTLPVLGDIPASYQLALIDENGDELIGGGYARATLANNLTNFPTTTTGEKANLSVVSFGTATADWLPVEQIKIFDAANPAVDWFTADLPSPLTVLNAQEARYEIGILKVRET
jgi:hypothetical protein